jgi:hypothetical protein
VGRSGNIDPVMVSLGATRLRRRLDMFLGGMRRWPANERARRNLQIEIGTLDRTGLLDDVLRYVKVSRCDVRMLLGADAETPHCRQGMLKWFDLADRMRVDDRRRLRDNRVHPDLN